MPRQLGVAKSRLVRNPFGGKRLYLWLALLASFILIGCGPRATAQRYATRAGTFEAAFPSKPQRSVIDDPNDTFAIFASNTREPVAEVEFVGNLGNLDNIWDLQVELAALRPDREQSVLRSLRVVFSNKFRYLVAGTYVAVGPVFHSSAKGGPSLGRTYIVVTPSHVYYVAADAPHEAEVRAFFNSFSAPGVPDGTLGRV